MDYVKVRDSAIALLLAGFVLKLLQSHTLRKRVDTQNLSRLYRETLVTSHVQEVSDVSFLNKHIIATNKSSGWVPETCNLLGRYNRLDPAPL